MARRKDAEDDRASRIVLDQLNTKTVGAPPSSTGLTGDQLPDTIFSVSDFDLVKNQVTLQLQNLELLNVLNTIGQITNTQSQSGPIKSTLDVKSVTLSDKGTANRQTIHSPDPGEVWRCIGLSATWSLDATPTFVVQVGSSDPYVTVIEYSVNNTSRTSYGEPLTNEITNSGTREGGYVFDIHYTSDYPLVCLFDYSGTTITTNPVVSAVVVRVR